MTIKFLTQTAFVASILCMNCTIAQAEGVLPTPDVAAAIRGANRRVVTASDAGNGKGYTAVRGTFDVPNVFVPSGPYYGGGMAPPPGNRVNSLPTFYLGCNHKNDYTDPTEAAFEVDAGVQYQWKAASGSDQYGNPFYAPPGWEVFVKVSNSAVNSGSANPTGYWRAGPGTDNPNVTSFSLEWNFERANYGVGYYGYLKVGAMGAVTQPATAGDLPGTVYACNHQLILGPTDTAGTNFRAKRVVGITQGGKRPSFAYDYDRWLSFPRNSTDNYDFQRDANNNILFGSDGYPLGGSGLYGEDGTYMRGCHFYNGQVGSGLGRDAVTWVDWDQAVIDDANTGFYPGGNDKTGAPVISSLPVFDFKYPASITGPAGAGLVMPARYKEETVDVNLRSAKTKIGVIVTPGGTQ